MAGCIVGKVDQYLAPTTIFHIEAKAVLARVALQQVVDQAQFFGHLLQVLASWDADV